MPMESVNVLVTTSIGTECLQQITAISPKIKIRDVSDLTSAEESGGFSSKEHFDALLAEAEVIYGARPPKNVISRAPKLKWIQSTSAGVDSFLDTDVVQSPVIVTNTRGMHATPMGELVFELILMFTRQAQLCFQLKQEKRWETFIPTVLRSKTVGVVGLGNIGREVARLAKAFGMRVVAIRRSARRVARARNVDIMLPRDQLHQLLVESDFVVLVLPHTAETNKLIGEEELRTMKPTAYLINVARGNVVDEEALIRALDENWIAGAGLDVFATEPLPTESRLWEFPNVLFNPHIGSDMVDYYMLATEIFCENLRRYLNGKKLLNVVDKKRGY